MTRPDELVEAATRAAKQHDWPPLSPIEYDPPTVTQLVLDDAGITTATWATGDRLNFSWIDLPAFDNDGYPVQDRGVTQFPGLYFLGLHWLYTMTSGSLAGVGKDAIHLAHHIAQRQVDQPQPATVAQ